MGTYVSQVAAVDESGRWWAVIILCLGVLTIAINATVVTAALPLIQLDLRFSDASLVWVVNAYLATFGGFLLLGGRLGDLFGRRRLFLLGISFFTLSSLACGLAILPGMLVAARFGQGLGGAIVSAVALSEVMSLFAEAPKRAKALGIYVFVSTCGGSMGLLLGGILTSALSWHWVFLANVPIGIGVCALGIVLLPRDSNRLTRGRLDVAGAVTATTSLMLAVYAVVNGNQAGWSSAQTLTSLACAGALLVVFLEVESRAQTPLIPLELFRLRNLTVVIIVGVLLASAVLAWRYVAALYLQIVLRLSPLEVGLTFLPANVAIAAVSLVVSPALVTRFGNRLPLVIGLLIAGVGLAFLARAPLSVNIMRDVLPGMFLLGLGTGMAYHPLLLSALNSVAPCNFGTASGIVNTSFTMGGALGFSVLVSIAAERTDDLLVSGADLSSALNSGYQVAFCIGAAFAAVAALVGGVFLRDAPQLHQDRGGIDTEMAKNICDEERS